MRKEKSVNLLFFKFGDDLLKTLIIVKKTLIINVCDIYEINAKLLKSLSSKSAIFYCCLLYTSDAADDRIGV